MQNLEEFKGIHSSELRGFFTGLILGDGTIDPGVRNRSFRIKSIDYNFIKLISSIISNNTPFKYIVRDYLEYTDKNNVHHKAYWQLRIFAHPYFAKLYHYFYNDVRHRVIHPKIMDWLNPIGLACWYMSDGYVCLVGKTKGKVYSRRMDISTDRYYHSDIELAISKLEEKFNIKSSIIKRGKVYRIRIHTESYETFIQLIRKYVVPSMEYKLYLGYDNKPKWMSDELWEYQKYLSSAIAQTDNAVGEDIV